MNVIIRYRGELRELTGTADESLSAETVNDILHRIKLAYGIEAYKQAKRMLITVDGMSIQLLDNYKTKLREGSIVQFHPICGGG